jgi:acetyl esterase/lipase
LLSDSETLHAKARAADVNTILSVVPGMQHVFPALAGRAPEADEEMQRFARWYRAL